ncbi:mCG146497, partial [Mus musculus]
LLKREDKATFATGGYEAEEDL